MVVKKSGLGKGLDSLIPMQNKKKAADSNQNVLVEKVIKKEEQKN